MTDTRPSAIVIGAGIVGAACAAALSERGVRTTVLERDFPACATTAAGMGHLVVMDDSPAQMALTARSLELWRSLADELPAAVEMQETGTLWIAEDDEQFESLRVKQQTYRDAGIPAEVLDTRQLHDAEPNLRDGFAGGLRVASDRVLYPPAATVWLLTRAQQRGATLRRASVDAVEPGTVWCGGERLHADFIVNAAGARAATLEPALPIVPRKGHLAITDRYAGFCRHQIVETGYLTSAHSMTTESVAFNVQPRVTGQLLIGSSRELVGWDASINRAMLSRMLARAAHFMPALSGVSVVRTWTGFRPTTPDKLPLIGWWDETAGLLIAAGHEGLGITTATATAEIIASLVTGQRGAIDPAPFAPTRTMAAA